MENAGLLMGEQYPSESEGLRERTNDRALRSMDREMLEACRIVNDELRRRDADKWNLRRRQM